MKNTNFKKIISLLLMPTLTLSILTVPTYAESNQNEFKEDTTTYIITTTSDKAYETLENEIDVSSTEQNEILEENNILVADLTEDELKSVQNNDDILLIEEDFELKANSITKAEKRELLKNLRASSKETKEPEWNMQVIGTDEIETDTDASETQKVKVAVLDSGVDIVPGINLTQRINLVPEEQYISPIFEDVSGHGTSIASIIVGDKEGNVQGINPNVELYSVKVLDGKNKAPLSRIIEGIYQCIEYDVDIITMSFGTSSYSTALKKAVETAYNENILMIAAAGNNNEAVEYPAAFDEVMAVAATGTNSELADFSNSDESLDIAAPGEKIKVTGLFGLSGVTHGTSIAVPHVAGVASLLWEKDLSKSNEFIRHLINHSAKDISNTDYCGLIDAEYAFELYDEFEKSFDETAVKIKSNIPQNNEEPETFQEIDDDEAYAEGRWHTYETSTDKDKKGNNGHLYLVESADPTSIGISNKGVQLLKAGAVYPDNPTEGNQIGYGWSSINRGEFHGRFRASNSKLNYIGAYCMISKIAEQYGDKTGITGPNSGLDSFFAARIKNAINENGLTSYNVDKDGNVHEIWHSWKHIIGEICDINGYTDDASESTKKSYRRHFLWGIAIHTATDAFAHSSFEKVNKDDADSLWWIIEHKNKDVAVTETNYYSNRFKAAGAVAKSAIMCMENRDIGDFFEFMDATPYFNNSFRLANLLEYTNQCSKAIYGDEYELSDVGDYKKGDIKVSENYIPSRINSYNKEDESLRDKIQLQNSIS